MRFQEATLVDYPQFGQESNVGEDSTDHLPMRGAVPPEAGDGRRERVLVLLLGVRRAHRSVQGEGEAARLEGVQVHFQPVNQDWWREVMEEGLRDLGCRCEDPIGDPEPDPFGGFSVPVWHDSGCLVLVRRNAEWS